MVISLSFVLCRFLSYPLFTTASNFVASFDLQTSATSRQHLVKPESLHRTPNDSHRWCNNTLRGSPFNVRWPGQAWPKPHRQPPIATFLEHIHTYLGEICRYCGSPSLNNRRHILTRSHHIPPAGCFSRAWKPCVSSRCGQAKNKSMGQQDRAIKDYRLPTAKQRPPKSKSRYAAVIRGAFSNGNDVIEQGVNDCHPAL